MELLELGLARARGKRPRDGVDQLGRLVALCEATFGEPSLEVVAARHHLALAHVWAGDAAAASELLQAAISSYYRHAMQHGSLLASMHVALGAALHAQGRLDAAEESYLHAIDIVHEYLGRDDPAASSAHANLGLLRLDAGRLDQAEIDFTRALRLAQCVLGVRSLKLASLHRCLGDCHARRSRWEDALRSRAQALDIFERQCGSTHMQTVHARLDVAHAHMRLSDAARAIGQLRKARAAAAADDGDSDVLVRTSRLLACAHVALGQYADARAELRSAAAADAEAASMLEAVDVLAAASRY
ncbi:hypothetical protein KFE25_007562 [Diacronema lutheri]|uniref:MalT-like TPR region domain-containing protein n=1 Tax=Diacronema lutheri TaxID=2081491 RepID=A0A8J6CDW8_DIALT|nr:hypothetical protein KFE25_007562 [Diacronema lutheri]